MLVKTRIKEHVYNNYKMENCKKTKLVEHALSGNQNIQFDLDFKETFWTK